MILLQMFWFGDIKDWPPWANTLTHLNHLFLVINSSSNIIIYVAKVERHEKKPITSWILNTVQSGQYGKWMPVLPLEYIYIFFFHFKFDYPNDISSSLISIDKALNNWFFSNGCLFRSVLIYGRVESLYLTDPHFSDENFSDFLIDICTVLTFLFFV